MLPGLAHKRRAETAPRAGVTVRSDGSSSICGQQVIPHTLRLKKCCPERRPGRPVARGCASSLLLCKLERHCLLAAPPDHLPRTGGGVQQASPRNAAAWRGTEGQSAAGGCQASAWWSPAAASTGGCCPAPAPGAALSASTGCSRLLQRVRGVAATGKWCTCMSGPF